MNKLIQFNTIAAIKAGDFEGKLEYDQILDRGNFGLGTFDELDGEMVGFSNRWFQFYADGTIHNVMGSQLTPFACVTDFSADFSLSFNKSINSEIFKNEIIKRIKERGSQYIYAIKITGVFSKINLRIVKKSDKSYNSFVDAADAAESIVKENIDGTIVAFWTPDYLKEILPAGFHFHFISSDEKSGGHVTSFDAKQLNVDIMQIQKHEISYNSNDFTK